MPLRFLFDVGVGRAAEQAVAGLGHDVAAVRDRDPSMVDVDILDWAVRERGILVTMDRDFGSLVYSSGMAHAGVLLRRMEDATGSEKAVAAVAIVTGHEGAIAGSFAVYQNGQLRLRTS